MRVVPVTDTSTLDGEPEERFRRHPDHGHPGTSAQLCVTEAKNKN